MDPKALDQARYHGRERGSKQERFPDPVYPFYGPVESKESSDPANLYVYDDLWNKRNVRGKRTELGEPRDPHVMDLSVIREGSGPARGGKELDEAIRRAEAISKDQKPMKYDPPGGEEGLLFSGVGRVFNP